VRRTLTATFATALLLVCAPAFADVVPSAEEEVGVAGVSAVVASIVLAAIWLVYRARRRR
jgi:hypothetical protein